MKKGFTLIELLAVTIILSIISIIVTPVIIQVIDNVSRKSFQNSAYSIVSSANIHYTEIMKNTGEKLFVFPQPKDDKLKLEGDEPKGGKVHINEEGDIALAIYNKKWCAKKEYNDQEVTVERFNERTCVLPLDENLPILTLNPPIVMQIGQYNEYIEPGYTLKTYGGKELDPGLVKVTGEVNTNQLGKYQLTYTVIYKDKPISKIREIEVVDMRPSILIQPNEQTTYVQEKKVDITVTPTTGNEIEKFTYTIIKNDQETETKEVIGTKAQVTLNQDGIFKIKVIVQDKAGNKNQKTSGIYKIDRTPPELTIPPDAEISKNKVPEYSLMEGVSAIDNSNEDVNIDVSGSLEAIRGQYTITYNATDQAGNSTTKSRTITVIEGEQPIINIYPNGTSDWVSTSKPLLIVTDDGTIQTFTYQLEKDGVLGSVVTVPTTNSNSDQIEINLNETGTYRIVAYAIDNEGMETTFTSQKFYIDAVPPTITFTVVGTPFNSNNWANKDIQVTIAISDDHTPKSFSYCTTTTTNCTPGTNVNAINGNVTINSESATNKICVKATDTAGNTSEITCSPTYAIDKTKPSVPTITKNVEKVKVTSGTDSLSGVWKDTYVLSGATTKAETDYITEIVISNVGTTNVTAYTIDKAGNKSNAASITGNNGVVVTAASCSNSEDIISIDGYCERFEAATRNETCTNGGSVHNGICRYAPLVNINYVHSCPSGYTVNGSNMVSYATCTAMGTAFKKCLIGTLTGGTCKLGYGDTAIDYGPPQTQYKCPDGSSSVSSYCSKSATTVDRSTKTCYLGGTLSGDWCNGDAPLILYTCDEGSLYMSNLCVIRNSACSSGTYVFTTGKCYQ